MRFSLVKGLALGLLAILLASSGLRGATNLITGQVTTNTTWSGTNLLQGTVTIQSNVLVLITPGTVMLMNTGATLMVNGQLLAEAPPINRSPSLVPPPPRAGRG